MAGDSNKEKMEELLKTLTRSGNSDPADFPSRNSSTGLHGSQADASYELSVPPSPSPKQLVQTSSQMRTTSQNTRIPRGSGRQKLSLNDVGEQYVLLLDAIDKLKLGSEIDLPEIVVLGDQSEGKSTVLEAIAKVKLPKGEGTCTKCLIRLSIRCKDKEHATIETFDGKSINVESQEDFSSKLKDIMNEKFPGQNISMNSVINIRVSGPDRPNLTVVDAPGFKSDMKEDDENTVALREKLNKPNILMVVVLKAVNDIDTSKGYDFAKRLDPEFKRTVFVLTHCDNLAENKQLKVPDMLRDRDAFAVHCYSKTGRYSSDEETDFFKRQSFWQNQPQSKLGLDALINHLAENMYRILRPRKEEFRSKLLNLWRDEAKELEKLKDENDGANSELKNLFIKLNKKLEEQLTGTCRKKKNELFSECKMKWNKFEQDLKTIAEEVLEPNHLKSILDEECEDQVGEEFKGLPHYFPVLKRVVKKHILKALKPTIERLISDIECIIQDRIQTEVKRCMASHEPLEKSINTMICEYLPVLRRDVASKIDVIMSMEAAFYQSSLDVDEEANQQAQEDGKKLINKLIEKGATARLPAEFRPFLEPLIKEIVPLVTGATSSDSTEVLQQTLSVVCHRYIGFVVTRIATSIPKAIIRFMLKRMSVDVWKYISEDKLDEETKKKLKEDVEHKIEKLEQSIKELQDLLAKFGLNS